MSETMTPEQIARFDAASNHPYECRCELCQEWWAQMPDEDEEPSPDPSEKEIKEWLDEVGMDDDPGMADPRTDAGGFRKAWGE